MVMGGQQPIKYIGQKKPIPEKKNTKINLCNQNLFLTFTNVIKQNNRTMETTAVVKKTRVCRDCGTIGKPSKGLVNFHNVRKSFLRGEVEFETKMVNCIKCPNCGHSWTA